MLTILTDVMYAYVNYDTPAHRPLRRISPEKVRTQLELGEFGRRNIWPKIEACRRFVESGGKRTVVNSPEHPMDALDGKAGRQLRA